MKESLHKGIKRNRHVHIRTVAAAAAAAVAGAGAGDSLVKKKKNSKDLPRVNKGE